MNKDYQIKRLTKSKWQGHLLPIRYTTDTYYDVRIKRDNDNYYVEFEKSKFKNPVTHTPEEYDFPDKLFAAHWVGAFAYGIFSEERLIGAIEMYPEKWADRLRITELWVDEQYHKQGIGKTLMHIAKKWVVNHNYRMIILETQSCNINAIGFYLHEEFMLVGFCSCDYSNTDLDRKEVRMELGWFNEDYHVHEK